MVQYIFARKVMCGEPEANCFLFWTIVDTHKTRIEYEMDKTKSQQVSTESTISHKILETNSSFHAK